jgi:S1-C subfamily serine protease
MIGTRHGRLVVALLLLLAILAGGISGGVVARLSRPEASSPPGAITAAPSATITPSVESSDIPDIIASVRPSVVAIEVASTVRIGPRLVTQRGAGTGVVLTSTGEIATCAHAVSGAQEITVTMADGSTASATVAGTDADADLAVIHIDRTGLVPMTLGRSSGLRVGQPVLVIGNALALEGGPTASLGIVSALGRTITTTEGTTYTQLIQTDAAMNAGDSGGPLIDGAGRLIGINNASSSVAENVGFAIPIDVASPILERLRAARQ